MYKKGDGVPQDNEKAFKHFKTGADKGYPSAQIQVAKCYQTGFGVEQSDSDAWKWFERAAQQGDKKGQYHLGCSYATGGKGQLVLLNNHSCV